MNKLFNYSEFGFELYVDEKLIEIKWGEINKITAYKIDLITIDEICLFVEAKNGKQFEINESLKGWNLFNEKLIEKFPSINKKWGKEIAIPPFERKETVLYNRIININQKRI